jgi:hypothetical protein
MKRKVKRSAPLPFETGMRQAQQAAQAAGFAEAEASIAHQQEMIDATRALAGSRVKLGEARRDYYFGAVDNPSTRKALGEAELAVVDAQNVITEIELRVAEKQVADMRAQLDAVKRQGRL